MSIIIRVVLRLFLRTRVGALVLGILLIVIGLIVGASSNHVSYENKPVGSHYNVISSTLGNLYIHDDGSSDWFVLRKDDIHESIIDISTLPDGFTSIFVARTDTIDVNANLGKYGSTTKAHVIEHLTFVDASGKQIASYSTDEYQSNPNGVDVNNWPAGGITIGLGVLLTILGVWIYSKRKPQALPAAPVGGFQQPANAQPMANPYAQPGANPYAQPGANPYAQPGANPYAQPVPNPYEQPGANPYAQPYQGPASVNQPGANPYAGNQYPQYPQAPQQ